MALNVTVLLGQVSSVQGSCAVAQVLNTHRKCDSARNVQANARTNYANDDNQSSGSQH